MKTPLDLLNEAQDNQLKVVAVHRLAVLKSQDELKKFRGEDNYEIAVATIVNEYPEGIVLTRLRDVLPDSIILDEAVKKLVEKKEITTKPSGKRSQLLKPVAIPPPETQPQPKQPSVPPNNPPVASMETNPTAQTTEAVTQG